MLTNSNAQVKLPALAGLRGSLKADKKTLKSGEPVTFTYSVSNLSKTAQTVRFSSGMRFDITVAPKTAPTVSVWQMNKERMFPMMVGSVTFNPGETKTFSGTWTPATGDLKPGAVYVASAHLTPMQTGKPAPGSPPQPAIATLTLIAAPQ